MGSSAVSLGPRALYARGAGSPAVQQGVPSRWQGGQGGGNQRRGSWGQGSWTCNWLPDQRGAEQQREGMRGVCVWGGVAPHTAPALVLQGLDFASLSHQDGRWELHEASPAGSSLCGGWTPKLPLKCFPPATGNSLPRLFKKQPLVEDSSRMFFTSWIPLVLPRRTQLFLPANPSTSSPWAPPSPVLSKALFLQGHLEVIALWARP